MTIMKIYILFMCHTLKLKTNTLEWHGCFGADPRLLICSQRSFSRAITPASTSSQCNLANAVMSAKYTKLQTVSEHAHVYRITPLCTSTGYLPTLCH